MKTQVVITVWQQFGTIRHRAVHSLALTFTAIAVFVAILVTHFAGTEIRGVPAQPHLETFRGDGGVLNALGITAEDLVRFDSHFRRAAAPFRRQQD